MSRLLYCALLAGILFPQMLNAQLIAGTLTSTAGKLKDVNGKVYSIKPQGKPVVYVFLSPECPLCKNYAPVLQELQAKNPDVQFYGIISGKTFTRNDIATYVKDYRISFPVLIDSDKRVATSLKATVTPEVLLIEANGREYYRGLVDNWVTGLGAKRAKPTKKYLELAIGNLLQGNEPIPSTRPIGCLISNF